MKGRWLGANTPGLWGHVRHAERPDQVGVERFIGKDVLAR